MRRSNSKAEGTREKRKRRGIRRTPPVAARRLLETFLDRTGREHLPGDFEEFYNERLVTGNRLRADLWYWGQLLRTIPWLIGNIIYWRTTMFWNYMKTALRNLARQKIFTTVNILGLAVGLSIFILAMLYVNFYLSYDKFFEDSGSIYCLSSIDREGREFTNAPVPIIDVLREDVPEIQSVSMILHTGRRNVTVDGKHFTEDRVRYADRDFLKIFSLKTIAGERETMLDGPNKIVLSRSTAVKWFGDQNPIGKTVNYESIRDLVVTGVIEDYVANSSINYSLLISFDTIRKEYQNWEYYTPVFVRLAPNADRTAVEAKLAGLLGSRVPESDEKPAGFFLYPFTKLI
ncbi:MAG: hypothetical protein EHM12_07050, partial [Dehalococcoidia bacterium]